MPAFARCHARSRGSWKALHAKRDSCQDAELRGEKHSAAQPSDDSGCRPRLVAGEGSISEYRIVRS
eukprot:4461916-Alexandrium_andersonii.AAC.1